MEKGMDPKDLHKRVKDGSNVDEASRTHQMTKTFVAMPPKMAKGLFDLFNVGKR